MRCSSRLSRVEATSWEALHTGKKALATIGLNYALSAARILIAGRQGRGIRMLVLQISCRPRVMRYSRDHGKIEHLHQGHSDVPCVPPSWMDG